jgi:hypothetical protein
MARLACFRRVKNIASLISRLQIVLRSVAPYDSWSTAAAVGSTLERVGLKGAGMSEKDVTLVDARTNETPLVLASGQADAIGAWQPVSGSAMKALPGTRPIYTTGQAPGLIYDVLYASPASLSAHRADYVKLAKLWDHVIGLTKSAPLDVAAQGIRVNAVCPGCIDTPMGTGIDPAAMKEFLKDQPIGRMGRPEEVAAAVLWLCSSGASMVLGVALPVDGGFVAH